MSHQLRSSPRKLKMANIESDGSSRPKTSSATLVTLSPRTRESATLKQTQVNNLGNAPTSSLNAKKRLAVQPQTLRPQTSPEVGTSKGQLMANRAQNRPKTLKHKAGNAIKTKTLLEKPEETPPVVQVPSEASGTAVDILVLSESRSAACHNMQSHVAQPGSCVEQDFRRIEDTDRMSSADKLLKDSSPPSRNNRYGNGIKTRLAKLFNKGNTCMEEPHRIHEDRSQAPMVPTLNGVHCPTRFEMAIVLFCKGC